MSVVSFTRSHGHASVQEGPLDGGGPDSGPWTVVGGTLLNGTFTPYALSYGLRGSASRALQPFHTIWRFTALSKEGVQINYQFYEVKPYRTLDTISIGRLWQAYVRAAARTWAGPTQAARSR